MASKTALRSRGLGKVPIGARAAIFVEDKEIKEVRDAMSKRNIFWIVLITVVVIVAIASGGYAIYRYGYMRGRAAESGTGIMSFFGDHMRGEPVSYTHLTLPTTPYV